MKVKCITTEVATIAPHLTNDVMSEQFRRSSDEHRLTIGETYVVYAIQIYRNEINYYVWGNEDQYAPGQYPAVLFEVIDPRPSSCWHCATLIVDYSFCMMITFPEWSTDPGFRSRLFDNDTAADDIWERYKKQMDAE